jgi:hypothetical protein
MWGLWLFLRETQVAAAILRIPEKYLETHRGVNRLRRVPVLTYWSPQAAAERVGDRTGRRARITINSTGRMNRSAAPS